MALMSFTNRLSYFLDYGSVHGIRYLGRRCGVSGKLFWLVLLLISFGAMAIIFRTTLIAFGQDIIDVNIDTAYLHWTNTFPAVALCLARGNKVEQLESWATEYFDSRGIRKPDKFYRYVRTLQDYLFLSPVSKIRPSPYCPTANDSCGIDANRMRNELLPLDCTAFMINLTYLEQPVANCADLFRLVRTAMGVCFVANSLASYDLRADKLPLVYDRASSYRTLSFSYAALDIAHYNLYVLSPEQLPYFNYEPLILVDRGAHYYYVYNTIEVTNTDDVRSVPIAERKCRFPDEHQSHRPRSAIFASFSPNGPHVEPDAEAYSISTCMADLRIDTELSLCNCTLPTTDLTAAAANVSSSSSPSLLCDYAGLRCLADNNVIKRAKWLHTDGPNGCMPSCVEMEINQVGSRRHNYVSEPTEGLARVTIAIQNVPGQRYRRRVAKTRLDVVVTVGGIIGLFFGASALSAAEFVYIWCVRRRRLR